MSMNTKDTKDALYLLLGQLEDQARGDPYLGLIT